MEPTTSNLAGLVLWDGLGVVRSRKQGTCPWGFIMDGEPNTHLAQRRGSKS